MEALHDSRSFRDYTTPFIIPSGWGDFPCVSISNAQELVSSKVFRNCSIYLDPMTGPYNTVWRIPHINGMLQLRGLPNMSTLEDLSCFSPEHSTSHSCRGSLLSLWENPPGHTCHLLLWDLLVNDLLQGNFRVIKEAACHVPYREVSYLPTPAYPITQLGHISRSLPPTLQTTKTMYFVSVSLCWVQEGISLTVKRSVWKHDKIWSRIFIDLKKIFSFL